MQLNINFKDFKKNFKEKKRTKFFFFSKKCKEYEKVENLFNFFLAEKNSFIFESVEKAKTGGDIQLSV